MRTTALLLPLSKIILKFRGYKGVSSVFRAEAESKGSEEAHNLLPIWWIIFLGWFPSSPSCFKKKKHMGEERTVVWGRRVTFYIHDLTPALVLLTPSVKIQIWGAPPQTILIRYCWWVGSISVFITCSPMWFYLTPKHKHHFLMRKLGFSIRSSQVVNVGGAAGAGPGRI